MFLLYYDDDDLPRVVVESAIGMKLFTQVVPTTYLGCKVKTEVKRFTNGDNTVFLIRNKVKVNGVDFIQEEPILYMNNIKVAPLRITDFIKKSDAHRAGFNKSGSKFYYCDDVIHFS